MGQVVKLDVLVGVRAAEVVKSVRLINDEEAFAKYYDPNTMRPQHYKFPKIFFRTTKKAFVSFISPEIVHNMKFHIKHISSYNAIRLTC
jgi:hypothetical protein